MKRNKNRNFLSASEALNHTHQKMGCGIQWNTHHRLAMMIELRHMREHVQYDPILEGHMEASHNPAESTSTASVDISYLNEVLAQDNEKKIATVQQLLSLQHTITSEKKELKELQQKVTALRSKIVDDISTHHRLKKNAQSFFSKAVLEKQGVSFNIAAPTSPTSSKKKTKTTKTTNSEKKVDSSTETPPPENQSTESH